MWLKAKQNKTKTSAHGAAVSLIYGTQSDRLLIPFPKCHNKGKCFRRNEACGWPQEHLNVNRVDYNYHFVQCFDKCAFVCAYDFLQ